MVSFLGYLGGLLLALCALPQLFLCYRTKSAKGLSWGLLTMWYLGEVLTLSYIIMKHGFDLPLTLNYVCNILILTVIIHYKIKEIK